MTRKLDGRMWGLERGSAWQGRSGRAYRLEHENLERFAMDQPDLYLMAKGPNVLWVGASEDLVADPMSRTRFRLALACADRVFRLALAGLQGERHELVWDLEGAAPLQALSAA